ncbi:MAG: hypothetical protein HYR84_05680 [Planctomycetes bacterium]|nr:hypothetical protein [Planctomycetota bacterium]
MPMADVESIELGLHFPSGVPARLDTAIRDLDNSDYREREKAAKVLLDLGPYAYPSLLRATRSRELEVSKRSKEIVQKLQAKYSKKDLKTSVEDRIVTPTQTIVGRILTPAIKTKADYFGEIDHKFAHMRSPRSIGAPGQDMELSVDAAKYANGADWMDTGFLVDGRSSLTITAKGLVDQWPQQPGGYMCGPGGNRGVVRPGIGVVPVQGGQKVVGPITGQTHSGLLIAKVGEDGAPFLVAEPCSGKPEAEGKLYLLIGPSPWNCASTGAYEVKIAPRTIETWPLVWKPFQYQPEA